MSSEKTGENKRSLYIAYTPMQIIMSVLIFRKYGHGSADIVISDGVNGMENAAENLRRNKVFENVYCVHSPCGKNECVRYIMSAAEKVCGGIIPERYADMFVCMSSVQNDMNHAFYTLLRKASGNMKVYGYIEGYSSYGGQFGNARHGLSFPHKIINSAARLAGKRQFIKELDGVYVFRPEMLGSGIKEHVTDITGLDIADDSAVRDILYDTFGYVSAENIIKEKYIFFEECFSEDRNKQQDTDIAAEIADIVGKENIIVKRHPRNKLNRFEKLGYKIMPDCGIPWEIYALDPNQPEHVYITFSSGAALTFRFFFRSNDKTVLLYKCFRDTHFFDMEQDTAEWFEKYAEIYGSSVYVPVNKAELSRILKDMDKQ